MFDMSVEKVATFHPARIINVRVGSHGVALKATSGKCYHFPIPMGEKGWKTKATAIAKAFKKLGVHDVRLNGEPVNVRIIKTKKAATTKSSEVEGK